MPSNSYPQRRDFLKTAVAGAAGAVGLGALRFDKVLAQSTGGWSNGMQINPAIDNKRVICCNDPNMLTTLPKDPSFTTTNNAVAAAVVAANLDEMAMQLAQHTAFLRHHQQTRGITIKAVYQFEKGRLRAQLPTSRMMMWRVGRRQARARSLRAQLQAWRDSCFQPKPGRQVLQPPRVAWGRGPSQFPGSPVPRQ